MNKLDRPAEMETPRVLALLLYDTVDTINGVTTIHGIYNSLVFQRFPTTKTELNIYVEFQLRNEGPNDFNVDFVNESGDVVMGMPIKIDDTAPTHANATKVIFQNVPIKAAGRYVVRVSYHGRPLAERDLWIAPQKHAGPHNATSN